MSLFNMDDKKWLIICILLLAISVLLIIIGISGLVRLFPITDCVVTGYGGGGGGPEYSCTPIEFDGYSFVFGGGVAIGFIPTILLIAYLREYLRNAKKDQWRESRSSQKPDTHVDDDVKFEYMVGKLLSDIIDSARRAR